MSRAGQQNQANLEGTFAGAFNAFLWQTVVNAAKFSIIYAVVVSLWTYFSQGEVALDVLDLLGFAFLFGAFYAFFEVILPWLRKNEPDDPVAEGTKAVLENRKMQDKSEQSD